MVQSTEGREINRRLIALQIEGLTFRLCFMTVSRIQPVTNQRSLVQSTAVVHSMSAAGKSKTLLLTISGIPL